jgi:hypothetical protein
MGGQTAVPRGLWNPAALTEQDPLRPFAAAQKFFSFLGEKPTCRLVRCDGEVDPNVWTGGALQEKSVRLESSGLATMYPALGGAHRLLAIMYMSAHSI